MSTQETKIKNYYITDIYNTFKSNRKNKLSYFGVTTSENNKYLSYSSDSNVSKFFANVSSPYPLSDNGKNSAYFKINNNTAYTIYSGHSFTYTEGVIVNGVKCALIAKSYINRMENDNSSITLETGNIFHSAESPQTVNIYSDTSYYINNLGNKDTLTITKSEFNTLLGNNNFVDVESFITYSYIEQKNPRDGIIHTDGKQRISNERYKDFHVWSFIDGFNSISHSYNGPTDNGKVNAYAYLAIGNDLKNYFESGLSRPINMIKLSHDLEQESLGNWTAGTSENMIYVKETEQNYTDFYTRAKAHDLSTHTDESFANVCKHPLWRNNNATCNFYEYIKGTSNGDTNNTTQQNIDVENYNIGKFIKRINDLPVHILSDTIYFNITLNLGFITGHTQNNGYASNDYPEDGGIQNFKLRLIESEQDHNGYKDYDIPLNIELQHFIRPGKGPSMKVIAVTPPESNDHSEYEINNWQQSPSSISGDTEQFVFTFDLKILDGELYNIFSYYENSLNSLLSILELQFEATGSCIGSDHAAINVSLGGKNCSTNKTNADYEWNIFRITRSSSNGYLSSINIEITYGEFNH